jgi:hypothetical protein
MSQTPLAFVVHSLADGACRQSIEASHLRTLTYASFGAN